MSSDNEASGSGKVKIAFRLTRDEEDWPPADWEHLWAAPRGDRGYELDNIPFFATGVASGDVVAARPEDLGLVFERVVLDGGHATVRVIMYDRAQKQAIRDALKERGCDTEGSHLPSLFAVDIPPETDYDKVIEFLQEKAAEDVLEYEEGKIPPAIART